MSLYPLVRPLAFALDAERAHRLTIRALKLIPPGEPALADPRLAVVSEFFLQEQGGAPRTLLSVSRCRV